MRRYAAGYTPRDARRRVAARHATGPDTLLVPQLPPLSTAAQLIQAELAQAGMTVSIVAQPVPVYLSAAGQGLCGRADAINPSRAAVLGSDRILEARVS